MRNFLLATAFLFSCSYASASPSEVLDSKIVSSIISGIEAEYQVECSELNFEITTGESFKIDGSCGGKDKWGDEYAAVLSLEGILSGGWVIVENMTIQLIP